MTLQGKGSGTYWHEEGAVISPAQLGDAVQEDRGHFLILVLHKAEHFEGEPALLAPAVFDDGGLRVLVTAVVEGMGRQGKHRKLPAHWELWESHYIKS